jgi:hypothetical protein
MNNEQEIFLKEKISWAIKNKDKKIWGILLASEDALNEMRDGITNILLENDISPALTYKDNDNNRSFILIEPDTLWAFAFLLADDSWDYIETIQEVCSIYEQCY